MHTSLSSLSSFARHAAIRVARLPRAQVYYHDNSERQGNTSQEAGEPNVAQYVVLETIARITALGCTTYLRNAAEVTQVAGETNKNTSRRTLPAPSCQAINSCSSREVKVCRVRG